MAAWRDRFRRWGWRDYATVGESFVVALIVAIALRLVSLLTIIRAIDWAFRSPRHTEPATIDVDRLARFAAAPYRLFSLHGTCLRESLVLNVLLRRRGVPAALCIGVRREVGLTAHAWVDIPGIHSEIGPAFLELRGWSD